MAEAPIHIAATTMLVRDNGPLEVLMVKRNDQIDFFSGAMLFPGGKVDKQDLDPLWANYVKGWTSVAEEERAPRIAALREAFEECGILVAGNAAPLLQRDNIRALRAAVEKGELPFLELVRTNGLEIDISGLTLFSRWLTPPVVPKRFDTFFYLVRMPDDQTVAHDGRETVENEWITPTDALAFSAAGRRTILFPTRMNLTHLAEADNVEDAVSRANTRPRKQVLPSVIKSENRTIIRLAETDGYGPVEEVLSIGQGAN